MPQLFRPEAVRHKLSKQSGTVLNCSRWTRPVAAASAALSAGLLLLIVFGHYTRAVAISGYLVPEGGILRVFAPQPGIVVEKRIKAGDRVVKGQTLFVQGNRIWKLFDIDGFVLAGDRRIDSTRRRTNGGERPWVVFGPVLPI